ncbi:MAG: ADP-ribosylglycohydrolase family protein [Ferruginibacter sp.]|nr:ADP-ribosylglycohydrolase family protein [Ferruginibacter sp.]
MKKFISSLLLVLFTANVFAQVKPPVKKEIKPVVFKLSMAHYKDKIHAIWASQIISYYLAIKFENNEKAVKWVDKLPRPIEYAMVDDDWYYEMITIKAFEKYGVKMTVEQLGDQWLHDSCGVYGSSAVAKRAMLRGIKAPMSGHPHNNRFYFTIGPMFSSDVYGALSPGMPNLAGKLARYYGHVNGYAEGSDGAVFVAGSVSAAFSEKNMQVVVQKASNLIDTQSPLRQCLDMVIDAHKKGVSAEEIFEKIETTWRPIYPMPNNAVANAGIIATCLLKGEGNFLKTLNLACIAGDNTDADCNAASAGAVIAAMHGTPSIPKELLEGLHNRIKGDKMGGRILPPTDETITNLADRTVKAGVAILKDNGINLQNDFLVIPVQKIIAQPAEIFTVNDMLQHWDTAWKIEHARKGVYIENDALITYPAITARSMYLYRTIKEVDKTTLLLTVAAEQNTCWKLRVFLDNDKVLEKMIAATDEGGKWQTVKIDLTKYKGKEVIVRLYQNVDFTDKWTGNAYWKKIIFE